MYHCIHNSSATLPPQSLFEHIIQPPPHLAEGWNSNIPTRLQKISGQTEKRNQNLFSIMTVTVEASTILLCMALQQVWTLQPACQHTHRWIPGTSTSYTRTWKRHAVLLAARSTSQRNYGDMDGKKQNQGTIWEWGGHGGPEGFPLWFRREGGSTRDARRRGAGRGMTSRAINHVEPSLAYSATDSVTCSALRQQMPYAADAEVWSRCRSASKQHGKVSSIGPHLNIRPINGREILCPFSIRKNESHIFAHENYAVILPDFLRDFLENVLSW